MANNNNFLFWDSEARFLYEKSIFESLSKYTRSRTNSLLAILEKERDISKKSIVLELILREYIFLDNKKLFFFLKKSLKKNDYIISVYNNVLRYFIEQYNVDFVSFDKNEFIKKYIETYIVYFNLNSENYEKFIICFLGLMDYVYNDEFKFDIKLIFEKLIVKMSKINIEEKDLYFENMIKHNYFHIFNRIGVRDEDIYNYILGSAK